MAAEGEILAQSLGKPRTLKRLSHSGKHAKMVARIFLIETRVVVDILMAKISSLDGMSLKCLRRFCCFGGGF